MKAGIRKTIDGLQSYMVKHGYTGLFHHEANCACELYDLVPCGEDHSECEFGYKRPCTPEEEAEGYDFIVQRVKPNHDNP